jgi:hypothetical protein
MVEAVKGLTVATQYHLALDELDEFDHHAAV